MELKYDLKQWRRDDKVLMMLWGENIGIAARDEEAAEWMRELILGTMPKMVKIGIGVAVGFKVLRLEKISNKIEEKIKIVYTDFILHSLDRVDNYIEMCEEHKYELYKYDGLKERYENTKYLRERVILTSSEIEE